MRARWSRLAAERRAKAYRALVQRLYGEAGVRFDEKGIAELKVECRRPPGARWGRLRPSWRSARANWRGRPAGPPPRVDHSPLAVRLSCAASCAGKTRTRRGETWTATRHDAAQSETYLAKLLYDEFGQRVHQRVGNGVVTRYAYEPLTRRLANVFTQKPGERLLQDLHYAYDLVGNVLTLRNALGEADPSHAGEVTTDYRYDDLHRLVKYFPDVGEGEQDLLGFGGVYNSKNLGAYGYANQNPVIFTDPDGNFVFLIPVAVAIVKAVIVSAAVGAASSAVISAGTQYAFTGNVDAGKVGRDASIGAVLGGVMGGVFKGAQVVSAARSAAQAAQQARTINAVIDPIAQTMRTTAVAGQGAAKVATGSGTSALTGAQRSVAQEVGAVASKLRGAGVHAEPKALAELAKAAGGKADAYLGISRATGFCPGCASELGAAGWSMTGTTTAILPVVNYGTQAAVGAAAGVVGGVGGQCVAE